MNVDLIMEFAATQALFEAYFDSIIIDEIQANAIKLWSRGIDDPAFV